MSTSMWNKIREDARELVDIGLFDMVQIAMGMSMAGPLFYASWMFWTDGEILYSAGIFVAAFAVLYFPSYVISRLLKPSVLAKIFVPKRLRKLF